MDIYQFLLESLGNPIVAYVLGVGSIVLGETIYDRIRNWSQRPKIEVEPNLAPNPKGIAFGLTIRNFGKTPLLEIRNKVWVNMPQLVIQGKLARSIENNIAVGRQPWLIVEEDGYTLEPQDLFPVPDSLILTLGVIVMGKEGFAIDLLKGGINQADLLGKGEDLVFSESATEAKPTKDLRVVFVLVLRGKAEFGGPFYKRFAFLLELPEFGGSTEYDFGRARMTQIIQKHEWESMKPFMDSYGFPDYAEDSPTPPFERTERGL